MLRKALQAKNYIIVIVSSGGIAVLVKVAVLSMRIVVIAQVLVWRRTWSRHYRQEKYKKLWMKNGHL